jgi:hypothetical protein
VVRKTKDKAQDIYTSEMQEYAHELEVCFRLNGRWDTGNGFREESGECY